MPIDRPLHDQSLEDGELAAGRIELASCDLSQEEFGGGVVHHVVHIVSGEAVPIGRKPDVPLPVRKVATQEGVGEILLGNRRRPVIVRLQDRDRFTVGPVVGPAGVLRLPAVGAAAQAHTCRIAHSRAPRP